MKISCFALSAALSLGCAVAFLVDSPERLSRAECEEKKGGIWFCAAPFPFASETGCSACQFVETVMVEHFYNMGGFFESYWALEGRYKKCSNTVDDYCVLGPNYASSCTLASTACPATAELFSSSSCDSNSFVPVPNGAAPPCTATYMLGTSGTYTGDCSGQLYEYRTY